MRQGFKERDSSMRYGTSNGFGGSLHQGGEDSGPIISDSGQNPDGERTVGAPASPGGHVHRWRIPEPEELTSTGSCTLCGEVRVFNNTLGDRNSKFEREEWRLHGTGR